MKRFLCFVCGRSVPLKNMRQALGLTCDRCYGIISLMPRHAQQIFSFVFRRLEVLEREVHGAAKARHRIGKRRLGGSGQAG